jgi:acyl-CoA reductase-like NAD-dependent aldehyde dehydrogenase
VVRRPLGVVASFTPWNGANILSWRAVLQPLAAGNTVVVKPSELAPVSAGLIVAEICEAAGFPPGVVNVVTHAPGQAGPIADEFLENPDVRCATFSAFFHQGQICMNARRIYVQRGIFDEFLERIVARTRPTPRP